MEKTLKQNLWSSNPMSLYFHIPFCKKRCEYCDFNTYAGKENLIPNYMSALIKEISVVAQSAQAPLHINSIFFGGGTPSLLGIKFFEEIFDTIHAHFNISPNAEITLEANPGTIDSKYLLGIKGIGINRLSLGAQSTNDLELKLLGRIHTKEDIFKSFSAARAAGFENINLDLIYGLPGQSLKMWESSLKDISNLKPEHLSLYGLTIEKGTRFGSMVKRGLLIDPDPDVSADMYNWSAEYLENSGFVQYEISNWAVSGFECNHNLGIWRNQMYLGFGAGAHGFAKNLRVSNVLRIKDYINRIENIFPHEKVQNQREFPISPATVSQVRITKLISMKETMILGLRLVKEGVSARAFSEKYGESIMAVFGEEITDLLRLNLLEWSDDKLLITHHGRLIANQVFIRFI